MNDIELPSTEDAYVSSNTYCTDGTGFGEAIHSKTEQIVLLVWFAPTVLGVVLGEVVILYLGLSHLPQYLLHHWLTHVIRELRPYNCGKEQHYRMDFASPCLSTMIVWSLTAFLFGLGSLRAIHRRNEKRLRISLSQFRMNTMGYSLLGCSAFVTWSVVYTHNNTWAQSLLGALVGVLYGLGSALFLEYVWSGFIPTIMCIPPFSWRTYTDSFYFHTTCKCRRKRCSHRAGGIMMHYLSHVYRTQNSSAASEQPYSSSS